MGENRAVVRGEPVKVIARHNEDEKDRNILGACVQGATVLVEYPDGERGYVQPHQLTETR